MGMTAILEAQSISFRYGAKEILQNASISLYRSEVVCLLGPNGSGKSTLLKVLLGLLRCHAGQVLLDGGLLTERPRSLIAKRMAYVPQLHMHSFPYSVFDIVLMGRLPYRTLWSPYSEGDRLSAEVALEQLRITHLKDRPYTDLSGGERQLTLIARALAQGAKVLIMDEPVTGLDYGNQIRLLEQLVRLAAEGFSVLMSTHFPDHALWAADRVILLKDGCVVEQGTTQDVMTPTNLEAMYRVPVEVTTVGGGHVCCVPKFKKTVSYEIGRKSSDFSTSQ